MTRAREERIADLRRTFDIAIETGNTRRGERALERIREIEQGEDIELF